jgi:hypothetical protein
VLADCQTIRTIGPTHVSTIAKPFDLNVLVSGIRDTIRRTEAVPAA